MAWEIFTIVFIPIVVILLPVFGQWNLYQIIDDNKFKRIKITKFKFLFRAIEFQSVEQHGIIIPLFVLQVACYPLSLFCLIYGILNILLQNETAIILLYFVFLLEVIIYLVIVFILKILSKRR